MRKLKLQMQITVDGFVAGPDGQLAWLAPHDTDDKLNAFISHLVDSSDTILLGRKMTDGFVRYWEAALTRTGTPEHAFAASMVNTPKIMFSRTMKQVGGKNIRAENGDLVQAVTALKGQAGKDLLVYGGATFVSALIQHGLIDELNFFVNPVAIGKGLQVFATKTSLSLTKSVAYQSGIVVNSYAPVPSP